MEKITIIIVTFNSDLFISKCLSAIKEQSRQVDEVIIIDNHSDNIKSLKNIIAKFNYFIRIIELPFNIGYAGAANAATELVKEDTSYVLYVAPDTFINEKYVEDGIAYLENPNHIKVGAISGTLFGYDLKNDMPSGLIDSTGIFQKWYGRWYDRDQKKSVNFFNYTKPEKVLCLCGTALMCRFSALKELKNNFPFSFYNVSFFMYKEDIDLSIRLQKIDYELHYIPNMKAFHCRGWNRRKMSYQAKILSARNEAQINAQLGLFKYLFSATKLYFVSHKLI